MTKYKIVFKFEVGIDSKGEEDMLQVIERAKRFVISCAIKTPEDFRTQIKLETWKKVEDDE